MKQEWRTELGRYEAMTADQRIAWLSSLLFFVSMLARETYAVESDGVDKPAELRKFNELLHRISSHLMQSANNDQSGMPDSTFFELLSEETDSLRVNAESLLKRLK